jgi:hypothetical protein
MQGPVCLHFENHSLREFNNETIPAKIESQTDVGVIHVFFTGILQRAVKPVRVQSLDGASWLLKSPAKYVIHRLGDHSGRAARQHGRLNLRQNIKLATMNRKYIVIWIKCQASNCCSTIIQTVFPNAFCILSYPAFK